MTIAALYMVLTGAVVGLLVGFLLRPQTVERQRQVWVRRSAVAAAIGAAVGFVISLIAFGEA